MAMGDIVYACSCLPKMRPEVAFSRVDVVFVGKTIQIKKSKRYGYDVKFKVLELYKGDLEEFVVVHTGFGGGDCGYPFVRNEE